MKKLFGRDKPNLKRPSFDDDSPLVTPRPYPLSDTRSSSFTSLPPSTSPSIPSAFVPRAVSPYSSNPPVVSYTKPHRDRDRDPQVLRKKPLTSVGPLAAVGILRALDPHLDVEQHAINALEDNTTHPEPLIREDKKDKRPFWDRTSAKERERDSDKERSRDKEKRDEDDQPELTRMIGYLTATASEDWVLVLEVCDRASANESNAKEAVKALRREFKYAEPSAQLSAARLWAIMLRNSSHVFIRQSTSRKFLDTIEDVLVNPRTAPVVRERLLDVVAGAAHATVSKNDKDGFRGLWRRVKPADKPDDGIPFDPEDAMFNPPVHQAPQSTEDSYEIIPSPRPDEYTPAVISFQANHNNNLHDHVIPLEEDIRRLFQECKVARGNATLLSEALMFVKPEDPKEREIVKEFYVRCRASQELIFAQIPWATSGAERSRNHRTNTTEQLCMEASLALSFASDIGAQDPPEATTEERLLAALLGANQVLLEALKMYDDLQRVILEIEEPEKTEHVGAQHNSLITDGDGPQILTSSKLAIDPASYSPSTSPILSTGPQVTLTQPGFVSQPVLSIKPNHATPLTPNHLQSLAPPPPAPHGPRLLSHYLNRSRTPSPEPLILLIHDNHSHRNTADVDGTSEDEYDVTLPSIGLSEKALGKRRVIDDDEVDRTSDGGDSFFGTGQEATYSSDSLDMDLDDAHKHRQQPIRYVYDAAAERTRERIKYELSAIVNEVH